jgi:hypothetical protein
MGNGRAERSRKSEESPGKNLTHGLIHLLGRSTRQRQVALLKKATQISLKQASHYFVT